MGCNYRDQSCAHWYTSVLVLEQTHKQGRVVSCGQIGYCLRQLRGQYRFYLSSGSATCRKD